MEIRSVNRTSQVRGFRDAFRPPPPDPGLPPDPGIPPDQPGPPLEPPGGSVAEEIERLRRERAQIWKNLARELLQMHATDIANQKELHARWNAMVFQQIVPSAGFTSL